MPNAEVAVGKRRAPALASSGKFSLLGGGCEFEGFSIALDTNCIGVEECVSTALVRSIDHGEDQGKNARLSFLWCKRVVTRIGRLHALDLVETSGRPG